MNAGQRLDPWLDAAVLAQRLREPDVELLVLLGAEAWCSKCQRLRPAFDQLAQGLPGHLLPMWLDIEEHAEFLEGFLPPDLPLLLRWRQGSCVQAAVVEDTRPEAIDPASRVRLQPVAFQSDSMQDADGEWQPLPPLWRQFTDADWAQG